MAEVFIPIVEVAEMMKTSPEMVKSGILNHTFPVGTVMNCGGKDITRIPRARLMKWLEGEL